MAGDWCKGQYIKSTVKVLTFKVTVSLTFDQVPLRIRLIRTKGLPADHFDEYKHKCFRKVLVITKFGILQLTSFFFIF